MEAFRNDGSQLEMNNLSHLESLYGKAFEEHVISGVNIQIMSG